MNTTKNRLLGGGSVLPVIGRMTPRERAMGRYLRGLDDHPPAGPGAGEEDEPKPIDPAAHAALASAHERLKRDAKADRDALKELKDRLDAAEAEKQQAEEEKATKDKDVEGLRTQLETKHGRELKAATDRAEKAERQVEKLVIDNGLSAALDEARVKPELKRAAAALLREGVELKDDDGEPVAYKGGLPLAEAIKLWAEGDEGKPFVLAGNNGGGAPGGKGAHSGPNPWKQGPTFNLTDQDRIEREKPELAARLKAEAGAA
ncbi:hypothetical protein [Brevundimonas naejangsanensis]|uniref:hypothetical protein n=1 Tax=Brevundimonas naejangsanensis TaxID=588932 RepID=UPI0003F8B99E|nr:hypothetical protein [Brevundimonas naejangsanensis]